MGNSGGTLPNFNNIGTFRKTVLTGTTTIDVLFNNYRFAEVMSGTLSLTGEGANSAIFNIAPGALVLLSSAPYTFNTGTSFIGDGLARSTGTTTVNGTSRVRNLEQTGGTINGPGNLTVLNSFNWTGGTMSGSGSTSISTAATMAISGSANKTLDTRTLNNAGAAAWSGTGDILVLNNAAFNNSGTFDAQNSEILSLQSGSPAFNNSGTFTKSAGAGTTSVTIPLTSTGTLNVMSGTVTLSAPSALGGATNVQTGTLSLVAGGSETGAITVSSGGLLNFGGGTHNVASGASIQGSGVVSFTAGTTNLAGGYNLAGLTGITGGIANVNSAASSNQTILSGGTLGGIGTFTAANVFTWTGGTMSGAGATNIPSGAALNIGGTASKFLDIRTLNNAGLATWTGTGDIFVSSGAPFNNSGTFDAQTDRTYFYNFGSVPTFNNSGIFTKSQGSGVTTFSTFFSNSGVVTALTGTLTFSTGYTQAAGSTNLSGGNITATTLDIQGGKLTGTGTVSASVFNSGEVNPGASPGILTISGNYTQRPDGSFDLEIGGQTPGTEHDKLVVTGLAVLGGTLDITVINGFSPHMNSEFTIMDYSSVLGGFASVTGTDLGNGRYFVEGYNPTNAILTVRSSPATVTPTGTATATPTSTPLGCGPGGNYTIAVATGTMVPGASDIGNHCDDCVSSLGLPFPVQLYGIPYTSAGVSSNGNIQFTSFDATYINTCLPYGFFSNSILAYWDDVRTDQFTACSAFPGGCGIFTSVSGTAPNRIFNIEWRTVYYNNSSQRANFEMRLYEGQDRFDFIYGITDQGGGVATIGVQRDTGSQFTQYECDTAGSVTPGLRLTFQIVDCPTITPTATQTATPTGTPQTATPTGTLTYTPTATPTGTLTYTPTATATAETPTFTPTAVSTSTPTAISTHTQTETPTSTPTGPVPTFTPTPTPDTSTSTPTSTIIPTNTVTPSNTATATATYTPVTGPALTGRVTWQGRPGQPHALQQLPITLTLKLGATEFNYPSQSTDSSGFFTVSVSGMPTGTYQWRVKGPKYLANSGTVPLNVETTSVEMGLMRAGDSNNDNVVSAGDFNILRTAFGKGVGEPGYDDRADFTGDGLVSIGDFNLQRSNFGLGGAPPVMPLKR
jgi:hypothetical protein